MFELVEKIVGIVGCLLFGHYFSHQVKYANGQRRLACAHCPRLKDPHKRRHRDSTTVSVITALMTTIIMGYLGWMLGCKLDFDARMGAIFGGFIGVALGLRLME